MKRLKFKKIVIFLALLVLLGQTVIPTAEVFAETLTKTEQSSQSEEQTEQQEATTDTKEGPQETVEENSTLPSSTESSETNQSNAPPATETNESSDITSTKDVKDLLDTPKEVTNQEDADSLTTDADGNLYYNGEQLFYEDGKVPANMEELFKKGIVSKFRSVGGASIQYNGSISWGYYTVGNFEINGKQAFCLEHPKGTPATGTPNGGLEPYDNNAIRAILYWGWGGPKNIFSDKTEGIVATSLALSHVYYGDTPGTPPSGYYTLIDKANAGDVPKHDLFLNGTHNLVNLAVTYNKSTGIQKSATATLKGDSSNSISFSIPSGIKFVNESTGKTATSGTVKVSGGQKYHFEADAKTAATISKTNLQGTVKAFQPLLVKPTSSGLQTLGTSRWYVDPDQTVSFKAVFVKRNGDAQLIKVDADTGEVLKGAKFEYTINGVTKTATTNDQGIISIKDILDGTKITVKEVVAPNGYALDSTSQTAVIRAGETIKIKVKDTLVKGQVHMIKTGEKLTTVDTEKTDYGTLYRHKTSQELLEGVTFDIYARKDIVTVNGKVQFKANDKVASYKTDKEGKFTSDPLYVGSYYAVEKSAPNGYIIKSDEIDFTINYEGELVPLTSSSIKAENNWNKAKVIINKLDESLVGYEDNDIKTEEINSTGKVFGLFRTDAYTVGDVELSPADALVGLATTEDGKAKFEGKYPDGNYYAMELNSGDSHVINKTKYPVILTPTDNREELEANVYTDATFLNNENFNRMARTPIVNTLFKTSVPFEKINETSKLEPETGYVYEYNQLGEGAEFELSNADGQVIQKSVIDKEGHGNWKDLVVGEYTFKESKPSNDTLVLDKTIYGIKVTQEKTVITDTKDGTVLVEVDNTAEAQKQSEAVTRVDEPEDNKTDETTQSGSETTKDEETTTSTSDASKEDEKASTDNEVNKEEVKEPIIKLKNKAIRGRSEIDKTDVSDGKKLPNTGIEIKDEKGRVVTKGRTDKNGNFAFDNLPKGKYTFVEYEAPKGYVIDSTPVPFEIKEDGDIIKCQMTNVKETDRLRQTKSRNDAMMALTVMVISVAGFIFIVRSRRDESLD